MHKSLYAKTRALLAEAGLSPKHALGQHFLIDATVLAHIIQAAQLEPSDVVEEIGPGLGVLTEELLARAKTVVALEKDPDLAALLQARFARTNLVLLKTDALSLTQKELKKALQALPEPAPPTKLVANLPYNIAATMVLKVFQTQPTIKAATVMVQREVAERMQAKPGAKAYGAYTVKLALYARATGSFLVSPESFYPPPHVASAVISLVRKDNAFCASEKPALSAFVDRSFAQRRKTLLNNLKQAGYRPEQVQGALNTMGFSQDIRAERLTPEDFSALYQELHV